MFFGVFLAPIFAIILFNTVVFVLVIRVLLVHSRRKIVDAKDAQKYKATLKTLISIAGVMLMFGLSWLFGAFTIGAASPAFQWLFVIFNAGQGFYLFVFFCVIGKDARDEWLNLFSCVKPKKPMSMHSKGYSSGTIRKAARSGSTKETLISRGRSRTMMLSAGLQEEAKSDSTFNNSEIELSHMSTHHPTLESVAEETVIANGMVTSSEHGSQIKLVGDEALDGIPESPPDLQVPPHILARLQGPYYSMHREDSMPTDLTQLTQAEIVSDGDYEASISDESDESTKL